MSSNDSTAYSCSVLGEWKLRNSVLKPTPKLLRSVVNAFSQGVEHDRIFSFRIPSSSSELLIHQSVLLASSSTKPLKSLVSAPFREKSSSTITLHEQDVKAFNAIRSYLYAQPIDLSKYDYNLALTAHRWEVFPLFNAFLQVMMKKHHGDVVELVKLALALHHLPLPESFLIHLSIVIAHNFDDIEKAFGKAVVWGIVHDKDFTCKDHDEIKAEEDGSTSNADSEIDEKEIEDLKSDQMKNNFDTLSANKKRGSKYNENRPDFTISEQEEEQTTKDLDFMRLWKFLNDHNIIVDVIKYMMLFSHKSDYFDLIIHIVYNLEKSLSDKGLVKILYYMDVSRVLEVQNLVHDNGKPLSPRIYQLSVRVYRLQSLKFSDVISFNTKKFRKLFIWNWPFEMVSRDISLGHLNDLKLSLEMRDDNLYARIEGATLSAGDRGKTMMRLMTTGSSTIGYCSSRGDIEFPARFVEKPETKERCFEPPFGNITVDSTNQVFLFMSKHDLQNLRDSHHEGCSIKISMFSYFEVSTNDKRHGIVSWPWTDTISKRHVSWIDDDLLE